MSASMSNDSVSTTTSSSSTAQAAKPKLPIASIPDMRFEQSFLASIRTFVHEVSEETAEDLKRQRLQEDGVDRTKENSDKRHSLPGVMATKSRTGEPEIWLGRLRIEWPSLLYLTLRDQIFSPIIQGAVFGVGGLAVGQLRAFLIARRKAKAGGVN